MGERTHTPTGFRVAESRSPASEIDFIPAQPECLAASPTAHGQEASHRDSWGPDIFSIRLTQRITQRLVLSVTEPSLTPTVCKPRNAMYGVIRAYSAPHPVGENCAQEPYGAVSRPFASSNARQSSGLRLGPAGRLAFSDIMHEALDIFTRDSTHGVSPTAA